MLKYLFFYVNNKLKLMKINFYIVLYLSISILKYINCQGTLSESKISKDNKFKKLEETDLDPFGFTACQENPIISNNKCFNNILLFEQKKYQENSFAINKNGDFLVQYNEYITYNKLTSSRLFYGLKKNGSYFFSNKSSFSQEFNITIDEEILDDLDLLENQDSKNLFVSLKNDISKKNQYLFSINSYDSMVELYDLNNDNNNYIVWSFNKFFKLDDDDYSFLLKYELFEIKEKSEYFIAIIPLFEVDELLLDVSFIKRFSFKSFDKDTYEELSSINYEDYLNNIIINIFLLEDSKTLVVLSINETIIEDEDNESDMNPGNVDIDPNNEPNYKLNLKFYNSNLKSISFIKEVQIINNLAYSTMNDNLFIKSLYLNILSKSFVIFIYITDEYHFFFDLFEIKILDYQKSKNIINPIKYGELDRNIYYLNIKESLNDFIKINDERVVFIYILTSSPQELNIVLININQFDLSLHPAYFSINLDIYNPTQIKGFAYNGYLLFSANGVLGNDYYYHNEDFNIYLSLFMVFGYVNGTDSTIDISKVIFKEEYNIKNNFFNYLFKNLSIENNIFGYLPLGIIKLVSIPKEISIFQRNLSSGEEIPLEEPFIYSNCIADDDGNYYFSENCPDYDYVIKQNSNLIKTSEYYYIDYQYIIEEYGTRYRRIENLNPEDDEVIPDRRIRREGIRNLDNFYTNPYPSGRINRLKFKLCHQYCETCYELGISNDEQKCESCLPEYQYDYLYFSNRSEENPDICVPENYYYNKNKITNKLTQCNQRSKYYFNTTSNKRICFPNREEYQCPPSYPIYNKTSRECFNCDFESFKNGECNAENLKMDSCTQCDYDCFIIGGCNFDNFNNTNDDFYERIINGGYISNYDCGVDLKISNSNGYSAQITTIENELP